MTEPIENENQLEPTITIDTAAQSAHEETMSFSLEDRNVSSEHIDKLGRLSAGNTDVEMAMHHPGPKDYLSNAARGAAMGTGAGVVRPGLQFLKGFPVEVNSVLSRSGKGGLIGALIGIGITPLACLAVRKYKGEAQTRLAP